MILLDADVAVDVLRGYAPALEWIGDTPAGEVSLPGFVVMELIRGCDNRRDVQALRRTLRPYGVLWPKQGVYEQAVELFGRIHLSHGTGIVDTLIGVMAAEMNIPLHGFNEKHYRPVPGLTLVQPYDRSA